MSEAVTFGHVVWAVVISVGFIGVVAVLLGVVSAFSRDH